LGVPKKEGVTKGSEQREGTRGGRVRVRRRIPLLLRGGGGEGGNLILRKKVRIFKRGRKRRGWRG